MARVPKVSVKGVARRANTQDKKSRAKTKDSFQNFGAGLGIGADNTMSLSGYGFNPISRVRTLLEWIHRGSWLGGVAIDLVADDMTRAGVKLKGEIDPSETEKIEERLTTLRVWGQINENIKWSRLYGGSLGVMMVDGQKPETPLNVERVGKDQFRGIMVLDRWMVEPSLENLVTEMGPDLGLPKFYRVTADAPALRRMTVHHSRCMRLEGVRLPYWQRLQENLWGISVLERLYDRMVAFDSATTGAAQLVYKSYLRTYKVKNLREIVATGGKPMQGLQAYVDMMRRFQSIEGITLLDGEDEFEAHQFSGFSGLSDALLQFGQQLAGALQIPLVRLFGQSPTGMNATGESDLRTYYDGINQQQNAALLVPTTNIYRMAAQSLGVHLPEGFGVEFNPLWQLTEEQRSKIAADITTAVTQTEEAGVVKRSTALKELKQSSEITGVWTNIDQEEIEEAEAELPPAIEEALGQAQEGAPQSATDMILGPDPAAGGQGGGEKQGGGQGGDKQKGKTQDAAPGAGSVKVGSGGIHVKWEESKHKRAGKGQTQGKSKGGQFVSGGGGGSSAGEGGGDQQPQGAEPESTRQLRQQFRMLEAKLRARHPEMKTEQIAAELVKQSYKMPGSTGRVDAGGMRNHFGAMGGRGESSINPSDNVGKMKLEAAYRGYLENKPITQMAKELGVDRNAIREHLRQKGVYKEFGGFPHGHELHKPVGNALRGKKLGGQQTHIRNWFKNNPDGGTWGKIAEDIVREGKMKANQPIEKVVKYYLNEWKKNGFLEIPGKAKPQPKNDFAAQQLAKAMGRGRFDRPPVAPPPAPAHVEIISPSKVGGVESSLKSKAVSSTAAIGGGHCNAAYKVVFADGSKGAFKPHSGERADLRRGFIANGKQTEREVGAWEVAKLVGMQDLVVPAVDRTVALGGKQERGVMQQWLHGEDAMNVGGERKFDGRRDQERAAIFDFVIGNTDRHAGNWKVNGGHLELLDHGLAFPDGEKRWEFGFNNRFVERGAQLEEHKAAWLQNKDKIIAKMNEMGLSGAAGGVRERIELLDKHHSLNGAVDAWKLGDKKGKGAGVNAVGQIEKGRGEGYVTGRVRRRMNRGMGETEIHMDIGQNRRVVKEKMDKLKNKEPLDR